MLKNKFSWLIVLLFLAAFACVDNSDRHGSAEKLKKNPPQKSQNKNADALLADLCKQVGEEGCSGVLPKKEIKLYAELSDSNIATDAISPEEEKAEEDEEDEDVIGGRRIETEDGSGDEEGPIESREKIEIEKTEQTDEVHVDNGKIDDGFENALREKRRLRPRSLSPPKTVPIIVNDSVVLIEEVKRKGLSPSGIDEGSLEREPDASL